MRKNASNETADRLAVTYLNVPQLGTGDINTFQIEMRYNGEIHVTGLRTDSGDAVAGLSEGNGEPGDFLPTDLSAAPSCLAPSCPGDVDGDGDVDLDDLNAAIPERLGAMEEADVNDTGWVEILDMMWIMNPNNQRPCP